MNSRPAFTLLELLIVIFIMGLGASIVVPRLTKRKPDSDWSTVIGQCNNMLYFARQESITQHTVYRMVFDRKGRELRIEVAGLDDENGKTIYSPARSYYFTARYQLPDEIALKEVRKGKRELLNENKGIAYCYVVPNGLAEGIAVTFIRTEQGKEETRIYDVQPFLGNFVQRPPEGRS